MHKISISPLTRANSVGNVTVLVEDGKVVDALNGTGTFKGFELIMEGRDPWDAPYYTQRICGICSSAHGITACLAIESLAGVQVPANGLLIRNIIFALDFLQNHLRHFFLLVLWDWVLPPAELPFDQGYTKGFRFSAQETKKLREHYWLGAEHAALAHEALTLLGGKTPHNHGLIPGGVSSFPKGHILAELRPKVKTLKCFIENTFLPDVHLLEKTYKDYLQIGKREENYLSFGLFPHPDGKDLFPSGALLAGKKEGVDYTKIAESLDFSWFRGKGGDPWESQTIPDPSREVAYSWIKAPRYRGISCEGGPLARDRMQGRGPGKGNSVLQRIIARAYEALRLVNQIEVWLEELKPGDPYYTTFTIPESGRGVGALDAMRGPLSHWVTLKNGRISSYQIITPSAWNFSPREEGGSLGPVEEALIGTPVENIQEPVEIGRVIRSFDPCYSCAAHVLDHKRGQKKTITL